MTVRTRTCGLAGAGLHEWLLDVRREELAPTARGAALGLALAVRDRPAGLAAEVPLTALRTHHGRCLREKLPDLAKLARDAEGIDPRSGLVSLHKAVHQRLKPDERLFHERPHRP